MLYEILTVDGAIPRVVVRIPLGSQHFGQYVGTAMFYWPVC